MKREECLLGDHLVLSILTFDDQVNYEQRLQFGGELDLFEQGRVMHPEGEEIHKYA